MDIITAWSALAIAKTLFWKTWEIISEDLALIYQKGRDKIIEAYKKKANLNDNKSTNLRITKDIFTNWVFFDDEISAEYFWGILASSRSDDGKDDSGIVYTDIIKSISSTQLELHYLIYSSLNKKLSSNELNSNIVPWNEWVFQNKNIFLSAHELIEKLWKNSDLSKDLHVIFRKGLLNNWSLDPNVEWGLPFVRVGWTAIWVQLYAAAFNKLGEWQDFCKQDYWNWDWHKRLQFVWETLEELILKLK